MSGTTETIADDLAVTLVEALRGATEEVRGRVHRRMARRPAAGECPDKAIDVAFELQYRRILDALRGRRSASPAEREFALFRSRPDLVLAVCSATFKEAVERIREVGDRVGGDPDALLEIISAVSEASDTALMVLGGAGRRGVEPAAIGWDAELRVELARALLLSGRSAADLRSQATVFGIDIDRDYVAFRGRPCSGHTAEDLARELGEARLHHFRDGLVAHIDGDLVGFLSAPPVEVCTGVVGVGPPATADDLADSFQLATRAFDTAHAFHLAGVHSFDTLGLLPAIVGDADVGESVQRRYLQPVGDVESLPELLATIRTFFDCGMRVERAAKEMFLHPNTLRNRISRFEELTGAKLRDPRVAIEVWWALQRVELNASRV